MSPSHTNESNESSFGLRPFIAAADSFGEIERVTGAHWDREMSALSELVCKGPQNPPPAVLFDDVPGYPTGYRTLFGITNSANRLALAVGMEPGFDHPLEFIEAFRHHSKHVTDGALLDPRVIDPGEAPLFENQQTGDDVDIFSFPVPRFQDDDGGRYIGTADCVITQSPADGAVNVGTYRMQAFDSNAVGILSVAGHHGHRHIAAYHDQDDPAPIAAAFGMDPTLWNFSSYGLHHDNAYGEYAYTGGLKGEPFPVVEGPVTGIPLPANAEIVIEGFVDPEETRIEGPFGETFGYYGSDASPRPFVDVKAIYHRDDPILTCASPSKPPYDYSLHKSLSRSANLWNQIEAAGVPDVTGVWRTEEGGARLFNIIAIDQQYAGHARQAGHIAAHTQAGGQSNRWTIVVDDDVDPTNLSDVVWAMSSRCSPDNDIAILSDGWGTPVDPLADDKEHPTSSRAIVDATIPYKRRDAFPDVVEHQQSFLDDIASRYESVITGTDE